jgi:oligoendopeptidase F
MKKVNQKNQLTIYAKRFGQNSVHKENHMSKISKPYQQKRWSRDDLLPTPTSKDIEPYFKEIDAKVAEFETFRAELNDDISKERFMEMIKKIEEITVLEYKMYSFASLWFAEDTQNQQAQGLNMKVEQYLAEISNKTLFFSLWWKALSDETANRLMKDSGDYYYFLEEMRHFKKYTLSEAEEKILNIKNVTGKTAMDMLYDSITNRYVFKVEVDGEIKELTRGELMVYARHHNPELRAKAYQELYRVYGEDGPILGQIYQTNVRDWRNEQINLRGFETPISTRNLVNDIPDEVIDTLLDVAKKNAVVFQRFFKLKAKWIGVDKLRRYDVYAPVVESDKTYDFDAAYKIVMESFTEFEPSFAEMADSVFAEDHLDSEVRKGKRGGAFCATAGPDFTPWVLLNYQGRPDDVATMAHELGHAIHSMLADKHSIFTQHACLPLAETASTFGEMMLVDKLLAEETDEDVRRDLLFRQIDDAYATIMRQCFFAIFERDAHEMTRNNASVDELSEAYLENLKLQFGDAIEVNDEFKWEWVSIPHIYHVPFYVYAYAFGQLLVFALYQRYKQEGDSFKPHYVKILETGGSKAPIEILAEAGFDVTEESFWQGGFDMISEMVGELEKLPIP